MAKTRNSGKLRDDTARIVAEIHGVSVRYVQMVRNGEREDEDIMATLVEFQLGKNNLIKHLTELVPLTSNPEKYARQKN
jgi:ribosomal protein L10